MAILAEKEGVVYKSAFFCLRTRVTAVSDRILLRASSIRSGE